MQAASAASGCQERWSYAPDAWRIVPDAVVIDHDTVTPRFHVDNVYIPGSSDQDENFSGYLGVALDAGPLIMVPVEQQAHVVEPHTIRIRNMRRGKHRLEISLFQGDARIGSFSSCLSIPSARVIKWANSVRQRLAIP